MAREMTGVPWPQWLAGNPYPAHLIIYLRHHFHCMCVCLRSLVNWRHWEKENYLLCSTIFLYFAVRPQESVYTRRIVALFSNLSGPANILIDLCLKWFLVFWGLEPRCCKAVDDRRFASELTGTSESVWLISALTDHPNLHLKVQQQAAICALQLAIFYVFLLISTHDTLNHRA